MQPSQMLREDEKRGSVPPYVLWGIWLMWLPFLIQPIVTLAHLPPSPWKVINFAGLALFFVVYLWATWQEAYRLTSETLLETDLARRRWLPIAILAGLGVLLCFVPGNLALGAFIYTSASVAGRLRLRQAALVIGGLVLLTLVLGVLTSDDWANIALMLFLVAAVGATVVGFCGAIRTNRELRLARREIARLAVSEARLRFARDLHDSVKQHLFAVAMQVGAALSQVDKHTEATRQHLLEADTLISQAQQELTALIHELRPSALQQQHLTAALRDQAQTWSRLQGIAVELDLAEERRMPLAVEEALWRIAQEALANVARHSQASKVQVRLSYAPEQVTLAIADNGRGFDPEREQQNGIGLHSMRERMAGVGGTISIQSRPGEGVCVLACCPLPQEMVGLPEPARKAER
jgi:signal transduction histidine kinase